MFISPPPLEPCLTWRRPTFDVAVRTTCKYNAFLFDRRFFNSSQDVTTPYPLLFLSLVPPSHDDAGDWDAAALVAVALDAL